MYSGFNLVRSLLVPLIQGWEAGLAALLFSSVLVFLLLVQLWHSLLSALFSLVNVKLLLGAVIVIICRWILLKLVVEGPIVLRHHAYPCRLKRWKMVCFYSRGLSLKAKLNTWLRLVKVLLHWVCRCHKITKWWSLVDFILLDHRWRLICFIYFLVDRNLLLYFRLYYFVRWLYIQTFLNYCLGSFLACFDGKSSKRLVMLATGLWLIITLCSTIPPRVVEYYLGLLLGAFDFAKLDFPLFGWHYWEITLTSIWKIKYKLPFVYTNIKLGFLSVFA